MNGTPDITESFYIAQNRVSLAQCPVYEPPLERTALDYIKRAVEKERSDVYRDIGRNKGTVHGRVRAGR